MLLEVIEIGQKHGAPCFSQSNRFAQVFFFDNMIQLLVEGGMNLFRLLEL